MQVKLLRAIQEKAVRPVGAEEEIPVDVRIISATHKDLPNEIKNNQFRQDLYYRINVIEINVPSLRERAADIPVLSQYFLERFAKESGLSQPAISESALYALQSHPFPGNIRELENTLERAFTLCDGGEIDTDSLQLNKNIQTGENAKDIKAHPTLDGFDSLDDYLISIEKNILTDALERNRWNKTAAAEELGISFRQIRHKLKKYGIE